MRENDVFSEDYAAARGRFRQAALQLGWHLEEHPIDAQGPRGETLTIDVAISPDREPEKVLVLSSGVHGVEGYFGSAVQTGLLEQWSSQPAPPVKCVFVHGLNPYGFAYLRRFDENNVDPNRNFLLAEQKYAGAPRGYAGLDPLLNPRRPPWRWEPFLPQALWAIARRGMASLQQTIAAGQYEYPRGLFFGGRGPSQMHAILQNNLPRWLSGSSEVVHFDFHTGLGASGTYKLLIDYPLSDSQRQRLSAWFGPDSFAADSGDHVDYSARGGLGQWCVANRLAPDYLFACAEFGTYGPIQVLAGLRAENQSHHWGQPASPATQRAKRRLRELFCPASPMWRSRVLEQGYQLVNRALEGLARGQ